jgi:hypothetical protein
LWWFIVFFSVKKFETSKCHWHVKKKNNKHKQRKEFDLILNVISFYSYDKPVRKSKSKKASLVVQSHYQNLTFDDHDGRNQHEADEEDEDHTYLNIRTYDIPRSATNIYDQPRINGGSSAANAAGGNNLNHVNNNNNLPPLDSDYDYPKGLIPLSARLLLNASRKHLHHYDADSLDGDQSPGRT